MVASHNQASIERTVAGMAARGLAPSGSGVFFGQLLGMADNLTFTLGQNGYESYKYLPFGPIKLVRQGRRREGKGRDGAAARTRGADVALMQQAAQRMHATAAAHSRDSGSVTQQYELTAVLLLAQRAAPVVAAPPLPR